MISTTMPALYKLPGILRGPPALCLLSLSQSLVMNKVFQLYVREHFSLRSIPEQVDMAAV